MSASMAIRCIDYLAYRTIFTRAMFRPKKKLMLFFFPPEKPEMSPAAGGMVPLRPAQWQRSGSAVEVEAQRTLIVYDVLYGTIRIVDRS